MLKWLWNVRNAFRFPRIDALELEYLHAAHDRLNLEHRQREVERGLFRQRFGY